MYWYRYLPDPPMMGAADTFRSSAVAGATVASWTHPPTEASNLYPQVSQHPYLVATNEQYLRRVMQSL